jgi:hypothetical protein
MRQILAVILTLALSGQLVWSSGPPTDLRAQVRTLPIGTPLEVKMKSGERVRGRLSSVDSDRFTLAVGRGPTPPTRVIPWAQAQSVKTRPRTATSVVAWVAAGAILAVVVVIVAVILIERHNEGG